MKVDSKPMLPGSRPALIIAHPGHELRVYGWLELARPSVFILTDGSGRSGPPRTNSSVRILNRTGAKAGAVFGRFTEAILYTALLNGDFDPFVALVDELADSFVRESFDYVAGDATEGYNPLHDVCRALINSAIEIAKHSDRSVGNYAFPLVAAADWRSVDTLRGDIRLQLDDATFDRKMEAALSYPELALEVRAALSGNSREIDSLQTHEDLADEVDKMRQGITADAFRIEYLHLARRTVEHNPIHQPAPFYERYGERQVAAGYYSEVIRYAAHVAPLEETLRQHVLTRAKAAACES
jgi:hypothetical protein